MNESSVRKIQELIRHLYDVIGKLEHEIPDRKFTPDGHLVGSLGESIARCWYGLHLLENSSEAHDARASNGRLVQIKATQRNRVALYSKPEHLIVLSFDPSGKVQEEFNGPGEAMWHAVSKKAKNGQSSISIRKLRAVMDDVPPSDRLKRLDPHE
jgi:hypothetical protein